MRLKLFAAAAGSAALVFVLVLAPASFAVQRVDGVMVKPDWFDSRAKASATPTAAQRDAVAALVGRAGAGTRVTWDHRFGTPRTILNAKGYLSGPSAGLAVDVARAWVDDNRAALGLSAGDIQALAVTRDHALPGTDTHVVDLQQVVAGVQTVAGGRLIVAVTGNGRVSATRPTPPAAQAAGRRVRADPRAGAGQGGGVARAGVAFTPSPSGTEGGYDVFARGPFATVQRVGKAAFLQAGAARPAYRVLFVPKLDEGYDVVLDAGTGAVLYRRSLVAHESEGSVYENFPGAPQGGTQVTRSFGPTPQSPGGYTDPTGLAGIGGPTTFGNNANTYANYSNFLVPADQGPRPVSPTSQFDYPYAMNWQHTNGQVVPPSYALDLDPATTNLFWQHDRIHDEYYDYGFTETAGNFQLDNFGKGGSGGDAVLGLVHAGAASGGAPTYTGRDNAYFLEQPDGVPSWSGMFLWEPINDAFEGPFSDGNFDASVVQHEYTHGLSTRYVGGGEALNAQQSGSMGGLERLVRAQPPLRRGPAEQGGRRRVRDRQRDARHPQLGLRPQPARLRRHRLRPHRPRGPRRRRDLDRHPVGPAQGARRQVRRGEGRRGRRPAGDRRDAADCAGPVVPRRARRHPRRRSRPLSRRRLRHHLDRLRAPRRGRVGHVAGRRRHRPAPGLRPSRRRRDGTLVGTVVDAASGAPVANARVIVGDSRPASRRWRARRRPAASRRSSSPAATTSPSRRPATAPRRSRRSPWARARRSA